MEVEIGVALITLTGTIALGLVGAWWNWLTERRSARVALLSEVKALAEVARARNYLQGLQESANDLEQGIKNDDYIKVSIADHYRCVYDAHLTKLGCLSKLEAEQVVRFYQLADAVIRDVSPEGVLYQGTDDPAAFREAASLLEKALNLADKLNANPGAKLTARLRRWLCQSLR